MTLENLENVVGIAESSACAKLNDIDHIHNEGEGDM